MCEELKEYDLSNYFIPNYICDLSGLRSLKKSLIEIYNSKCNAVDYKKDFICKNSEYYASFVDEILADNDYENDILRQGFLETIVFMNYKLFESRLKRLLKDKNLSTKCNYVVKENKIEKMNICQLRESFLKWVDIDISQLNGFKDLDELRLLNNSIKHVADSSEPAQIIEIADIDRFDTATENFFKSLFENLCEKVFPGMKHFNLYNPTI